MYGQPHTDMQRQWQPQFSIKVPFLGGFAGRRPNGSQPNGSLNATASSSVELGSPVSSRFETPLSDGSASWIRTATNQRPERQPGVFSRLPDEVVRPYSTCMEMENSIFALAEPRKVPLTGAASKGSLEAATATWEAATARARDGS